MFKTIYTTSIFLPGKSMFTEGKVHGQMMIYELYWIKWQTSNLWMVYNLLCEDVYVPVYSKLNQMGWSALFDSFPVL